MGDSDPSNSESVAANGTMAGNWLQNHRTQHTNTNWSYNPPSISFASSMPTNSSTMIFNRLPQRRQPSQHWNPSFNGSTEEDQHSYNSEIPDHNSNSTNTGVVMFPQPNTTALTVLLTYPYDFFHPKTGAAPKDATAAIALWPYRKQRPAPGLVDIEPPDGQKMQLEVKSMRERLKLHIENAFMSDARAMADYWKLKTPVTDQTPVTKKDLEKALGALERTEETLENEKIAYMVCHHFHHQREWLSSAVDAWCQSENIKIEYPAHEKMSHDGIKKRFNQNARGGFGAFARNVKADIVKQLIRNMLSQAGWAITTKDNSKQGHGKNYEKISIRLPGVMTTHTCYILTLGDSSEKKKAAKRVTKDELKGLGAHICSELGVDVSEDKVNEWIASYQQRAAENVVGLKILGNTVKPSGAGDMMSEITCEDAAQVSNTAAQVNSTAAPDHQSVEVSSTAARGAKTAVSSTAAPSYGMAVNNGHHQQVSSTAAPNHQSEASSTAAPSNGMVDAQKKKASIYMMIAFDKSFSRDLTSLLCTNAFQSTTNSTAASIHFIVGLLDLCFKQCSWLLTLLLFCCQKHQFTCMFSSLQMAEVPQRAAVLLRSRPTRKAPSGITMIRLSKAPISL